MSLPAIVFFIVFSYLPIAGLVIAFKQYNYRDGIFGSPWAGIDNFQFFFISGKAWLVTSNTFLYNLAFIIINNLLEIVLAVALVEISSNWLRKVMQSMLFLPYFVSWVTVGLLFFGFANFDSGIVNSLLQTFGAEPIDIYNTPGYWPIMIVLVSAWKAVGYGMIYYMAAIMGVDPEIYEAAEIDGANIFRKIWHLTIPYLIPTVVILLLLAVGNIFRGDFGLFYQLVQNNGVLFDKTDVIDTFVFRSLLMTREEGMAAAAGFYQSVLCFVTIMMANFAVKKYNKDYSLF
ncbi:sugar ABC transporter permease [Paenibacillus sp. DLE-14]|uniref:Sugar ABC transporter permease n=2 Tax=Paenibacillus lignilyticus TaxID=1172615 RepID=A0ABS5CEH3_9BACL|nr:ABC transporter permease subunit [Paenibacillus lignilyticus]MBP3961851.1 sugar ABC transporter permease [Paenibacillus lignilyticus]MBP3963478.1 sugar ABC transporter permease [Paenibacillus lignilyticus]